MNEVIKRELDSVYGPAILKEQNEIIKLYEYYDKNEEWDNNLSDLDYVPTQLITNLTKKLIKKEARFLFGKTPKFIIVGKNKEDDKGIKIIQDFVDDTIQSNLFDQKLIKAAIDCFIGKRVALKVMGSKEKGIKIMFKPSLEFVHVPEVDDVDEMQKIIYFYTVADEETGAKNIWKQKWEIVNGKNVLNEGIYDSRANIIKEIETDYDTGLDFINSYVIINGGLSGDISGESDIDLVMAANTIYNKLKSDDIDALKFNMFPMDVAINASEESLKKIVRAPNALVDLQAESDDQTADYKKVEMQGTYDQKYENTVNRIKNDMHDLLSIPNISLEQLQGLMQSGKSMEALYWDLVQLSDERLTVWGTAFKWMINSMVTMARTYGIEKLPDVEFDIEIEHQYSLQKDIEKAKEIDLKEVDAGTRSKRSYIKKHGVAKDEKMELLRIYEESVVNQDGFSSSLQKELDEIIANERK